MGNWQVRIDWDNNLNFTDLYDDISSDIIEMSWHVGFSKPYETVITEIPARIVVVNDDGKYNPENTSSPIFGKILPWRRVEIAKDGTIMYAGWLYTIDSSWQSAGPQTGKTRAIIQCVSSRRKMETWDWRNRDYNGVTADKIIQDVILEIQPATIPATPRWILGQSELGTDTNLGALSDYSLLFTGESTLYYGNTSTIQENYAINERLVAGQTNKKSAWRVLTDAVDGEGGRLIFGRDGFVTFARRNFLNYLMRISSPLATISEDGTYKPIEVQKWDLKGYRNQVNVTAYPKVASTDAVLLWSKPDNVVIQVPPLQSLTYEILLETSGVRSGGRNYIFYDEPTTTLGSLDVQFSITERGDYPSVTIKNNTAFTASVTNLKIAGISVKDENQISVSETDSASFLTYGSSEPLSFNLIAVGDYQTAKDRAGYELAKHKTPRYDILSCKFRRRNDDDAFMQSWVLARRFTINLASQNHNQDYVSIGEAHKVFGGIGATGTHECTWIFEALEASPFVVLDYGELDSHCLSF
jgi:hypothetical protein